MSRWWFQRFFIFTPIWGRFPFWLIFFKSVETTTKMSYFHWKWAHTSTKVKYTPWNPLTFPKNRENFSYWTNQVLGGFEFEGSRFSIFWRGTLRETNMSHLAKRNIIFKCAFFRGDVSPRRVDFQQFWDPKAMGPDLKDDWVPWKLDVFGKPQNLTGIRRPTWITNFFLKTCWEPNTSRSGISLGGGFKYVLFSLLFGEDDSHFDYSNIFRMGWNKTTN